MAQILVLRNSRQKLRAYREVEQLVARQTHNLEVTRSNRVFATT